MTLETRLTRIFVILVVGAVALLYTVGFTAHQEVLGKMHLRNVERTVALAR